MSVQTLVEALNPHYYVTADYAQSPDVNRITTFKVAVRGGQAYPYHVTAVAGKDHINLYQEFTERSYIKTRKVLIRKCKNVEEALTAIIKRHNKSCAHMTSWTKIAIPA